VVVAWDSSNDDFTITGNHTYSSAGTPTVTITVTGPDSRTGNANTAADVTSLTVTGETFSAVQGGNFSGNVATFTDVNANTDPTIYTASIDWLGDGSDITVGNVTSISNGSFAVSGNNTFTSAGTFNPVVTITDTATGNSTASGTATGNVSGIIASATNSVSATQGSPINNVVLATFCNTTSGTSADSYQATIDWLGNGTPVSGNITPDGDGNYTITGNITSGLYAAAGTFYPVVTVTDTANPADAYSATVDGEVDVAGITVTAEPLNAVQGIMFSGNVATFTDTAPDASVNAQGIGNYSAVIQWGDGSQNSTQDSSGSVTIAYDSTNYDFIVIGNHTYSNTWAGTPTVTVTVANNNDQRTGTASESADVTSLTDVTGYTFITAQGAAYTGNVATFHDTNSGTSAGNYSASIDWLGDGGDVTNGNIISDGNSTFTVTGNNTFALAGTFNPVVTITDTAAGNSTMTAQDTANVTGIIASAASAVAVAQGQASNNAELATFSNTAGGTTNDTYYVSIDWLGDGRDATTGNVAQQPDGNYIVTGNITATTYVSAGTFDPTVTITDTTNDTVATVSAEVDVSGITVSALVDNIEPGNPFSGIVATFTDTAPDANMTPTGNSSYYASVNWGDGNTSLGNIVYDGTDNDFTVAVNPIYLSSSTLTPTVSVTGPDARTASAQPGQFSGLYDTGLANDGSPLANGVPDMHYTANYSADLSTVPAAGPNAFSVDDNQYPFGNASWSWMPDSATSRWIGAAQAGNETWIPGDACGFYDYQTSFTMANNVNLSTFSLSGQWATDNTGLDILVNGKLYAGNRGTQNSTEMTGWTQFTLTTGFVHGKNTLDFVVENGLNPGESVNVGNATNPIIDGGPTGLRVEFYRKVVIGFFGMDTNDPLTNPNGRDGYFGNTTMHGYLDGNKGMTRIGTAVGAKMFGQGDIGAAQDYLDQSLVQHDSNYLKQDIEIFGYSRGGFSAIKLAERIHDDAKYKDKEVKVLATIDPDKEGTGGSYGVIPDTVDYFWNRYQTKNRKIYINLILIKIFPHGDHIPPGNAKNYSKSNDIDLSSTGEEKFKFRGSDGNITSNLIDHFSIVAAVGNQLERVLLDDDQPNDAKDDCALPL